MPSTPITMVFLAWAPPHDVNNSTAAERAHSRRDKERSAFHPGRGRDAEKTEGGGGQVLNAGVIARDFEVREKNTRDERRVYAMVAAPCFAVVLEHARSHPARGGIPRCAITGGVTDDQVGRGSEIGPAIDIGCLVDGLDSDCIFIGQAG